LQLSKHPLRNALAILTIKSQAMDPRINQGATIFALKNEKESTSKLVEMKEPMVKRKGTRNTRILTMKGQQPIILSLFKSFRNFSLLLYDIQKQSQ